MIILLNRCGQLANRLFMFANYIALAQKYNLKIMNLAFFEFERHFKQTSQDLFCRYPAKKFRFIKHREVNYLLYLLFLYFFKFFSKINLFKNRLLILDLDKNNIKIGPESCDEKILWAAKNGLVIVLRGWADVFETLDSRQAEAIKNYFIIKDEHQQNVDRVVPARQSCELSYAQVATEACAKAGNACELGEILVGVHIRHGDYRRFRQGKYFYTPETYVKFMNNVQTLFPDKQVVFLICSNEPQDPKKLAGLKYVFGPGHRVEDLYALACCDYLIGPPSTYTMWASFYGQVPLYMIEEAEKTFWLGDFKVYCADCNSKC